MAKPKANEQYSIRMLLILTGIIGILLMRFYPVYTGTSVTIFSIVFIVQLIGVDVILRESNIMRSPLYRLISLCISLYVVGALFIILKYPYAGIIMALSIGSTGVLYSIRTAMKKKHGLLDYAKVFWVLSVALWALSVLFKTGFQNALGWIETIAFAAMFGTFVLSPAEDKKQADAKDSSDMPIDRM
ncbi:MAG: hypothetical protein R2794_09400 [Chitinophagales bacterium]